MIGLIGFAAILISIYCYYVWWQVTSDRHSDMVAEYSRRFWIVIGVIAYLYWWLIS